MLIVGSPTTPFTRFRGGPAGTTEFIQVDGSVGRYVRITNSNDYLHLTEIQVIGL